MMKSDKNPAILIVDDNASDVAVLSRLLRSAGFETLETNSSVDVLDTIRREDPDLVLLAASCEDPSGHKICTALKEDASTSSIPVILIVANFGDLDVSNVFNSGYADYVVKPICAPEVISRVSLHVRLINAESVLNSRSEEMEQLVSELRESNQELAARTRFDSLTQLLNRRTWEEEIENASTRLARDGRTYGVLIIDVDCFKDYNDACGHLKGDECLRRLASTIQKTCRAEDSCGRFGGEEFVVFMPNADEEAALRLAERIRRAVWNLGVTHPHSKAANRVTVSVGVATGGVTPWMEALQEADDALYVAKRSGRNMVYCASKNSSLALDVRDTSKIELGNPDPEHVEPAHILVVDDEKTNRLICVRSLEKSGHRVTEASDGIAALEAVEKELPDVIILDVMMPRMDGVECVLRLKENPETRDIPVIMISAMASSDAVLAGLKAGADEYLAKPIHTSELMLRVRSMVRVRRDRADLLKSFLIRGEHTRILSCLVEFCRAISVAKTADVIIERAGTTLLKVSHSRRVSIMLPDESGQQLNIARCWGIDPDIALTTQVPIGDSIAGRVFESARSVIVNSEEEAQSVTGGRGYESEFFVSVPLLSAPLYASGHSVGVINVTDREGEKPFQPHELEYVELIAKITAAALQDLKSLEACNKASDGIMIALANLAEHRDNDTGLHVERVKCYCLLLAEKLRLTERYKERIDDDFLHDLARAAPLHDIGKVAIPDNILLKPGKLSDEQMDVMRTHAEIGARTLRALVERTPDVGFLKMAAEIAHYHHEHFDGKGYPQCLDGTSIPLPARITALADVYDALTTKRVYKDAISHDRACTIIFDSSGTHFDPDIVEAFHECEAAFEELAETMQDKVRPVADQTQLSETASE